MAIKVNKFNIKANGVTYKPGDIVSGLSAEEKARLLAAGYVVYTEEKESVGTQNQKQNGSERPDINALKKVLDGLTKADLIAYATLAEVVDVNDKMKNADIIAAIITDAQEKGVDFDAMNDEQLVVYATNLGIPAEGKVRAEIIDQIDLLFEANE